MKQCKRNKSNVKPYLVSFSFKTEFGERGDGSCIWDTANPNPHRVSGIGESIRVRNNFESIALIGITKLGL